MSVLTVLLYVFTTLMFMYLYIYIYIYIYTYLHVCKCMCVNSCCLIMRMSGAICWIILHVYLHSCSLHGRCMSSPTRLQFPLAMAIGAPKNKGRWLTNGDCMPERQFLQTVCTCTVAVATF